VQLGKFLGQSLLVNHPWSIRLKATANHPEIVAAQEQRQPHPQQSGVNSENF
jgi:hypothetical protein